MGWVWQLHFMDPDPSPEELNGHAPRQRRKKREILSDLVRFGHIETVREPEPLQIQEPKPKKTIYEPNS